MVDKFEFKKYLYYGLIAVISLIVLVFVPMIGTEAELGFSLPNTTAGWLVYIVTKILIAILNMLIFYCFMEQAKLNVRDNEDYKKANEILKNSKQKDIIPRSPSKWNKQQYSTKGISLLVMTLISTIALTNAILSYDYMSLLTYVIVLTIGVIFGFLQMKFAEAYWTNEYYQYAIYHQEELRKAEELEKQANLKELEQSNINSQESKKHLNLNGKSYLKQVYRKEINQ